MTSLVNVSEGYRDVGARATRMLVTVSDEVLMNETTFKAFANDMLTGVAKKLCDQFFEEHQEWVRDVFNVQSLRIALLDELQRRVVELAGAVDVAPDVDAPPDIRELITP
jgi:hypothetical protein